MRPRLRPLLWLLGFGCLWLPVFDDPPLHTGAYVQDVTPTSAIVRIVTAADEALSLKVRDRAGKTVAELATTARRRHEFAFGGLTAGQPYGFTVLGADGGQRDAGSFVTAPTDDVALVRFAVVGDSGKPPWWEPLQRSPLFYLPAAWDWLPTAPMVTQIGRQIASQRPDFLLHVGDIVYPSGMQGHYAAGFFRPFAEVLRHAPAYVTLGNHDVIEDDGRQALANFHAPASGFTDDGRFYSLAWGSVRVFVVDLNPPAGHVVEDGDAPDVADDDAPPAAIEFLRQELPRATEPWLVVVSHYPIESASRQGDSAALKRLLLPLLRESVVDLYLCGHDHTYQRLGDPDDLAMVVSGGGGKSLYAVHEHPDARVVRSEYSFCTAEVRGPQFVLRAHAADGGVFDTLTMTKPAGGPRWQRLQAANPARARRVEQLLR